MIYTILVQSSPAITSGPPTALKFARALIASGHSIYRIFLYGDGVHLSNNQAVPPQDELHTAQDWSAFIEENELDAVVCIAAALKRGVLNKEESLRYDKGAAIMDNAYDISGLGQLIDAGIHSDRVITFS